MNILTALYHLAIETFFVAVSSDGVLAITQVVDMPPGTGDVQITLSQCLPFTGAVVVTTPHRLSLVDAAKGVSMFQHMQIPTLALVR